MSASKRRQAPSDGEPQFAIHLTPASNLESIGIHGLLPSVGPLAKLAGETTPMIHLYGSVTEFSNEHLRWIGNILAPASASGHTPIALLAVDVSNTATSMHREFHACQAPIPAGCLDVVTFDLDGDTNLDELMDDYCDRRFTAQMLGRHTESSWRDLPLMVRHTQMVDAYSFQRTHVTRFGNGSRADVAQVSLFPSERTVPRS